MSQYEDHEGVRELALLSVPAHHWHLRAGAVGEVHLQHRPVYHGGHGGLYFLCVCAHSRAPGAGVLLGYRARPSGEHCGSHELSVDTAPLL